MKLRDWVVPDEVQSASAAGASLIHVARQTSHFWLKQAVGIAVPFLLGVLACCLIVSSEAHSTSLGLLRGVMSGVLTFVSVLAGFMVTLMLFTGRMEGAKVLTAKQAPVYVSKVTYLLFSQALTLVFHIAGAAAALAWLLINAVEVDGRVSYVMLVCAFGLLAVSMVRSLLLPLQIYEVHQFEFDALVEMKQVEAAATVANSGPGRDLLQRT